MADEKFKTIVVAVDLEKGLPWKGTAVDVDPTEDAWSYGAPPKPGLYKVQLSIYQFEFIKFHETDESRWGYSINIEGRIQGGDEDNIPVYQRVSTLFNRGKKTSTAIGALVKLGYGDKVPKQASPYWVGTNLAKIISKGPIVDWELDWKAGYKGADGKWQNVLSTYANFPNGPDGEKMHNFAITTPGGGKQELSAQLYMSNWVGKGEQPKAKAKAAGVSAGDLDLEDDTPAPKAKGEGKVGKAKVEEEDELDLD